MTDQEREKLQLALYANSPFDLGSELDDKYRNAIDNTLYDFMKLGDKIKDGQAQHPDNCMCPDCLK